MEMETFRDILCRQVDTLQMYFDSCAENEGNSIHDHVNLEMNDDMFEDDQLGSLILLWIYASSQGPVQSFSLGIM